MVPPSAGSYRMWEAPARFGHWRKIAPMRAHKLRRSIAPLFVAAAILTLVSWRNKGRLVGPGEILAPLLQPPIQRPLQADTFEFPYKGKVCRVEPVATYELWGLVVSHNDIESLADIYHDSTSVDTKDLCVVWGSNLEHADYQSVEFQSGPWTCYFRYPAGVEFDHDELGNNHLITDNPTVRRQLEAIRIGDQIHLEGRLVNYQMEDWQGFWRRTSTSRQDNDCEVVFLERLSVLRRGTPIWYMAYRLGWTALLVLPVLYVGLMWLEAGSSDPTTLGRL